MSIAEVIESIERDMFERTVKENEKKQYCRYCANLCVGDVPYCEEQNRTMSEATAKTANHCKDFEYNPIDAFNPDKEYKPREPKKKQCDGQAELF